MFSSGTKDLWLELAFDEWRMTWSTIFFDDAVVDFVPVFALLASCPFKFSEAETMETILGLNIAFSL